MEQPNHVEDNNNNNINTIPVTQQVTHIKKGKDKKKSKGTKFVTSDNIISVEKEEPNPEPVKVGHQDQWRVLWNIFYYDGPLYGLAEYKGNKVWFTTISQMEDKPRLFTLHALTPDNLRRIEEEHERYRSEVGYHTEHQDGMFQPPRSDMQFITFKHIDYNPLVGDQIAKVDETSAICYHPTTRVSRGLKIVQ